jgi:hypothetical protein
MYTYFNNEKVYIAYCRERQYLVCTEAVVCTTRLALATANIYTLEQWTTQGTCTKLFVGMAAHNCSISCLSSWSVACFLPNISAVGNPTSKSPVKRKHVNKVGIH